MQSILKCDLESKIKPPTPLTTTPSYPIAAFCDLSMSPTLRLPGTPDRAYTPILPPPSINPPATNMSPIKDVVVESPEKVVAEDEPAEIEQKAREEPADEPMEVDRSDDKIEQVGDVEMKCAGDDKETNMFYTPDDDEDRTVSTFEEPDTVNYVPPFNNPVYPNSNFASFTSTIGE